MSTTQASPSVGVERDGEIAILTLNRPEKRNALSLQMMRDLDATLAALAPQRNVRAIVLRGEGPAFSAGHDLRELVGRDVETYRAIFDACVKLMTRIATVPQPVIAEVAKIATAAGCQLVAACDLAVASSKRRSRPRRAHRALLQHADGCIDARDRTKARDGDVADR